LSRLVIRFSSLGDVILAAGVTAPLGDVTFVTRERYRPLVERFPGVEAVIGLRDGESAASLARRLPAAEAVFDLHASPRSKAVCARLKAPVRRVDKLRVQRWLRVAVKRQAALPTVLERYAAACGIEPSTHPWIPLERRGADALALVPGAAHATKGWSADRFAAVGRRWSGPVIVLGGPGEEALVERVAASVREGGRLAQAVTERGFDATLDALARCRALVAGDTGLMHLAAACGVPVVGVFGPTTSGDGFWCHPGEVVEAALACRPCSRYGGARCPVGDHRCMDAVSVDDVVAAVERVT